MVSAARTYTWSSTITGMDGMPVQTSMLVSTSYWFCQTMVTFSHSGVGRSVTFIRELDVENTLMLGVTCMVPSTVISSVPASAAVDVPLVVTVHPCRSIPFPVLNSSVRTVPSSTLSPL